MAVIPQSRFRPLIRGFFFYPYQGGTKVVTLEKFPSPHSGILFLYGRIATVPIEHERFPSSHSGILFLSVSKTADKPDRDWCFRFPSPHSGILFLYTNR